MASDVKRWSVGVLGERESDEGPWVCYEDHVAKVQALEAEMAVLKAERDALAAQVETLRAALKNCLSFARCVHGASAELDVEMAEAALTNPPAQGTEAHDAH